ncbi:MAG: 50S ribosomal protein L1 [Anaerolineae bacterium]|nr:50S ribosomal protein L1 [Anaerolineae bacterium]
MPKAGKRYTEAMKLFDRDQDYSLEEAVELVKKMATAKFDETIEMHFRLGIDPRQADQQIRSTLMLPHGLGKQVTVLVFAEGEEARIAQDAGADIIADDSVIDRIQKEGWTEFDAAIAIPSMMPRVGRLGRVLGPRGLMPTPKAGTVVPANDLARAIEELKAGRIEFRNDRTGNLHIPVGKASFELDKLVDNARATLETVKGFKPETIKGIYMRRLVITSTMGPGVRVNV